jgi:hypothetical protein
MKKLMTFADYAKRNPFGNTVADAQYFCEGLTTKEEIDLHLRTILSEDIETLKRLDGEEV